MCVCVCVCVCVCARTQREREFFAATHSGTRPPLPPRAPPPPTLSPRPPGPLRRSPDGPTVSTRPGLPSGPARWARSSASLSWGCWSSPGSRASTSMRSWGTTSTHGRTSRRVPPTTTFCSKPRRQVPARAQRGPLRPVQFLWGGLPDLVRIQHGARPRHRGTGLRAGPHGGASRQPDRLPRGDALRYLALLVLQRPPGHGARRVPQSPVPGTHDVDGIRVPSWPLHLARRRPRRPVPAGHPHSRTVRRPPSSFSSSC